MAELAACPFCGGTPTSTEDEDAHVFVVGCLDCGYDLLSGPVGVGWFKSLPDAIAAWNTRTHHAELEAVVRKAARYDWLKDMENAADVGVFGSIGRPDLDEAIDREMAYQNNSARDG